jgi:hypothetical protein
MENSKPSAAGIAFKWAVINLVTSIILTYGFQFLNIDPGSPLRYIAFIPVIAFLLLTQKEFRDKLNGFIKFGQAFVAGLYFAIFSSVLGAIFLYLYYSFLSPQEWALMLTSMETKMAAAGTMSQDQIDSVMTMYTKYGMLLTIGGALLMGPIVGAIISLIGAAIFKKEPTLADLEQNQSSHNDPAV